MIDFILAFLVTQSGSDSYKTRVVAEKALWQVSYYSGRYEEIEKGAKGKDAQVRKTCKRILSTKESQRQWVEVPRGLNLAYFDPVVHYELWKQANSWPVGEDAKVYVRLLTGSGVDPSVVKEMVAVATAKKRARETNWNRTFLEKWKAHLLGEKNGPHRKSTPSLTTPQP